MEAKYPFQLSVSREGSVYDQAGRTRGGRFTTSALGYVRKIRENVWEAQDENQTQLKTVRTRRDAVEAVFNYQKAKES